MAQEHDSWLSGIGVDVGRFVNSAVETVEGAYETVKDKVLGNGKEGTGGAEGGASESAEGETSEGGGAVKKFTFSKEVIPKIKGPKQHILGGRFEVEGEFTFTFEGTVELSQGEAEKVKPGAENEVALQYASKEFLFEFGRKWVTEGEGSKTFNWSSIITEAGVGVTAMVGEESKISFGGNIKIGPGTVKFEANVISYDAKSGKLEAGTLEFAGSVPIAPGKINVKRGVDVDLRFVPTFTAKAEPNWAMIFEKDVAPKLEALGVESLQVAGTLVLAFGAPVAAMKELVDGDNVNSAGKQAIELSAAFVEGHRLGVTGGPPPSDPSILQTYTAAHAKFESLVKASMQNNPGLAEDAVRKQISEAASTEFESKKSDVQFRMNDLARDVTWDAFGEKYQDQTSYLCTVWTQLHGGSLPKQNELAKYMQYSSTPPPNLKTKV